MTSQRQDADGSRRPGLLILFAPADHPHRDAVCATLAWVAAAEGRLFECYYDSRHSGVHFGGGLPWQAKPEDLRGGTFAGARHMEQFEMVASRFSCQAACLGATIFESAIAEAGMPVRARSGDVASFYRELFEGTTAAWPELLLVIARGGERVSLVPYACHEVARRRALAIVGGDDQAFQQLAKGMEVELLWEDGQGAATVEERSLAMAERWAESTSTYFLGDPEAAGRWIPTAIREGWAPVFGIPQARVIDRLAGHLDSVPVVWGRQQDDRDFLELSKQGVAFQLVDPGRPPFPILGRGARSRPRTAAVPEGPSDQELRRWAREGRILGTIVFWAGMVRELECLYGLAEIFGTTGLKAGLALTTDSFAHVDSTPLGLLSVEQELGGLRGQVETLLASAGAGGMIESAAPPERFARTLAQSTQALSERVGLGTMPAGWWAVMDAVLHPRRVRRITLETSPPRIALRYRRRPLEDVAARPHGDRPRGLRARVRESPVGGLFEPIRPFDGARPGTAARQVLAAVGAAGFEYALTKAEFGSPPTLVTGVANLTVLNYTAGRWDGWTPFETVNNLGDLVRAERRLLRSRKPGWLLGGIDSCLWTFSGHMLDRGPKLRDICAWMAGGGASGQIVNATPRTVARYARLLAGEGLVRTVEAS